MKFSPHTASETESAAVSHNHPPARTKLGLPPDSIASAIPKPRQCSAAIRANRWKLNGWKLQRWGPYLIAALSIAAMPTVTGILLGSALAWTVHRVLTRSRKSKPPASEWAWSLALLAAGLKTGSPLSHTAIEVAGSDRTELAMRLKRFGVALALGADAREAGLHLRDLPAAERVINSVERSSTTGAALASSLQQIAQSIHLEEQYSVDKQAAKAGISLLAPMFLCFLPAFVLTGLGPTIVGFLQDLT